MRPRFIEPLKRRLGGPRNLSVRIGEVKNSFPMPRHAKLCLDTHTREMHLPSSARLSVHPSVGQFRPHSSAWLQWRDFRSYEGVLISA